MYYLHTVELHHEVVVVLKANTVDCFFKHYSSHKNIFSALKYSAFSFLLLLE